MSRHNPLLYLIVIVSFSVLSALVVDALNSDRKVIQQVNAAASISTESTTELTRISAPVPVEVEEREADVTALPIQAYTEVDIKYNEDGTANVEEVLGCGVNGSETGCTSGPSIYYQPICSRSDVSITVGDGQEVGSTGNGVKVTKNSVIEVWKVTVPMALLSGSEYVKDSRMAIQDADEGFQGTFKPAYDVITDYEARAYCVPGVDCDDFDEGIASGPMGPYWVNVHAELEAEATNAPAPDKATITPRLNSACPDVQRSKPNPIKSNRKGMFVEANYQLPGQHAFGRNFSSLVCMKSAGVETSNHAACLEKRTSFNFLVYAIVQIEDWIDCTIGRYNEETKEWQAPDPELCKESVITNLKIDGLFGSTFKCVRNHCASRYMDLSRQGTKPPGVAQAMAPEGLTPLYNQPVVEPFYVSTPCMVRVDGIHFVDIPCIWDMSVYEADYQRQKQNAVPGSEDMPATFEEYWKMVEEQIKNRGEKC